MFYYFEYFKKLLSEKVRPITQTDANGQTRKSIGVYFWTPDQPISYDEAAAVAKSLMEELGSEAVVENMAGTTLGFPSGLGIDLILYLNASLTKQHHVHKIAESLSSREKTNEETTTQLQDVVTKLFKLEANVVRFTFDALNGIRETVIDLNPAKEPPGHTPSTLAEKVFANLFRQQTEPTADKPTSKTLSALRQKRACSKFSDISGVTCRPVPHSDKVRLRITPSGATRLLQKLAM